MATLLRLRALAHIHTHITQINEINAVVSWAQKTGMVQGNSVTLHYRKLSRFKIRRNGSPHEQIEWDDSISDRDEHTKSI